VFLQAIACTVKYLVIAESGVNPQVQYVQNNSLVTAVTAGPET
jgi:hypothetical protein